VVFFVPFLKYPANLYGFFLVSLNLFFIDRRTSFFFFGFRCMDFRTPHSGETFFFSFFFRFSPGTYQTTFSGFRPLQARRLDPLPYGFSPFYPRPPFGLSWIFFPFVFAVSFYPFRPPPPQGCWGLFFGGGPFFVVFSDGLFTSLKFFKIGAFLVFSDFQRPRFFFKGDFYETLPSFPFFGPLFFRISFFSL